MADILDRLNPAELASIMGCSEEVAGHWLPHLVSAMRASDINTIDRAAAFLAQIGHESGGLQYVEEIWGPTNAQHRYEGKASLGNTELGDGYLFRGRGLIQITGRYNYITVGEALGIDLIANPGLLKQPQYAAMSAAWYWQDRRLNKEADAGNFDMITTRINGGQNGADDRRARLKTANSVLIDLVRSEPSDTQPVISSAHQQEDKPMDPFALAAIGSLIQKAPDLIRIFGGDRKEPNAQAAEIVAGIAREVTGEATTEGAVQVIEKSPEAADKFRAGVRMNIGDLISLAEQDEKSRDAAMARNQTLMSADPRWIYVIGGIAVLVVLASYVIAGIVITGGEAFSPEVKAMVITGVAIGSVATVLNFLYGSSHGSRIKDERR